MRIKLPHVPYVSHKIAIDLLNCGFVKLNKGIEPIVAKASEILTTDVQKERALDERVNELLEKNEDEMQTMQIDRKNMFWLVKKKLAGEFDVILTHEDRFSNVAMITDTAVSDDRFSSCFCAPANSSQLPTTSTKASF